MTTPVAPVVATAVRLELLGTTVEVRSDQPWPLDRLRTLLAPFVTTADPGRGDPPSATFDVAVDPVVAPSDPAAVVLRRDGAILEVGRWRAVEAALLAALNALAIHRYDGLAFHAGVVARGDRVVAFPGASGAGKSTLTAACLGAGFDYVSDEALCIDPSTRRVVAYPRPLALSVESCALLDLAIDLRTPPLGEPHPEPHPGTERERARSAGSRELLVTAADLGAAVGHAPRLTDVVVLQRGATTAHLEPLHRSRLLPSLLTMSFNHFRDPGTTVEVLEALASEASVWCLHLDDPRPAAQLLARELG
jgi:hypothetical protein